MKNQCPQCEQQNHGCNCSVGMPDRCGIVAKLRTEVKSLQQALKTKNRDLAEHRETANWNTELRAELNCFKAAIIENCQSCRQHGRGVDHMACLKCPTLLAHEKALK